MLKIDWTRTFNPALTTTTDELPSHICKNCNSSIEGNFCNYCGQKKIEFNAHHLIDNLTDGLEFKRGLFYNLKVLTFTPATAMKDYMEGRTKPFLNPISYALIVLTVLFLTGIKVPESDFGPLATNFQYFLHYLVFTFPIMYGLGSYLAYVSKGYNYIQHLILSMLLISHFILICIIPFLQIHENLLFLSPIIFLIYTIWIYQLLFKEHIAVTITNQFTILLMAMVFELVFVIISMGLFYLLTSIFK